MTTMTPTPAATEPGDNPYNSGYFDGELDALAKLPAAMANTRASLAHPYAPLWAQGYADGYLHQIQVTYALNQKGRAT